MTQPLNLDPIQAAITDYEQHPDIGFACCTAHPAADAATALLAEVRRLRAELARRVQCNDCGAVGEVFSGGDGRAYLNLSGEIGFASA